jgi:3-hydroxyacyl-CoA dehydrogenase
LSTVAIIGAGPLGRWLAVTAARAGFRVFLEDVMPASLHHAQEYIRQQLNPTAIAEGLGRAGNASHGEITDLADGMDFRDSPAFKEETGFLEGAGFHPAVPDANVTGDLPATGNPETRGLSQDIDPGEGARVNLGGFQPALLSAERGPRERIPVQFVSTIEDAVREADLAIDCVPDELESKLEILWLLDRMAPPRTVLATPTTRLSIVDLAACTYRPGKCVAIVAEARGLAEHADSLITMRTTPQTSAETVSLVRGFWERLGFKPSFEVEAGPGQPASGDSR